MSVEDRLRHGLDANAQAFVPETEARLVQVHRRHRARARTLVAATAAVAATIAVAVAVAGPVSWPDRTDAPQPADVTPSTDAYTGPRLPDSGWRKVVTRAQLVRAGAGSAFLDENLGRADRLPLTLAFIGEVYSQSGRYRGSSWTVGDAGTLAYTPEGRLLLTSTAPGCRACVASLTWQVRGNRLELSGFRGTPSDPLSRVLLVGDWTRIDS